MRDGEAPEPSARHGRPACAASAAGLRPSPGADPASRPPRRGRRRVRERLLQLSALRARAVLDAQRAAAFEDRRVRQRGRISRLGADLSPLSARRRLSHLSRRQDALRRPRPAPRLRGACDHRRLSGRLPVDARLAARRPDLARVVPRHEQGVRSRAASAQRQRRLRRRGGVRGGALAARTRGQRGRAAVRAHRLVHLPPRPLPPAAALVGAVPRRRDRPAAGRGRPARGSATRTAAGTGSSPDATARRSANRTSCACGARTTR